MGLNANVLAAESDIAAAVGTTLNGTNYKIIGITVSQANFESIINSVAAEEQNTLGNGVYQSSDPLVAPAVKTYQVWDCAYHIIVTLPGYIATYFESGVGDTSFNPGVLIQLISAQREVYKEERDNAFRKLQNIMEGGSGVGTADATPQGIGAPQAPFY